MKSTDSQKRSSVFPFYIMLCLSSALYVYFLTVLFRNTFSGMFTGGFVLYSLFFLPLFVLPLLLLQLYRKWGRFYVLYLLLSCFYLFVFFIFVKTISYREKYRYFDPFLQIRPVLSEVLLVPKAENEVRILFLGGSTTRCSGLPEGARFPTLLAQKLKAYCPEKKITVLNAGMDWFTTRHSLTAYTQYYKPFDADIVVTMHAINDVVRTFTPLNIASDAFRFDYSHFYGPSAHAAMPERTYPEQLLQKIDCFYHVNILGVTDTAIDYDRSCFTSARSFRYYYTLLLRQLIADSVQVIVMSEPFFYKENMTEKEKSLLWFSKEFCYHQSENNYKPYGRRLASIISMGRAMRYFNNIAEVTALNEGALFIDAESLIAPDTLHFTDDVHFTAKASEEIADILFRYFKENNLIERK
ncbi:MAG: hypothetical protein BWY70_00821 [Bacteroidetes bacterium ADurb.Bin408]|nr:MAG: hypothetical protein BWY70_00821 [Bacteroidetes bacterium ADurb.Bin408]